MLVVLTTNSENYPSFWVKLRCIRSISLTCLKLSGLELSFTLDFPSYSQVMGVGSGGQGAVAPPGFSYMVLFSRSLFVIFQSFLLFFGLFSVDPSWKRLNSAIFGRFCYFSAFFSLPPPPEIFLPTLLPQVQISLMVNCFSAYTGNIRLCLFIMRLKARF